MLDGKDAVHIAYIIVRGLRAEYADDICAGHIHVGVAAERGRLVERVGAEQAHDVIGKRRHTLADICAPVQSFDSERGFVYDSRHTVGRGVAVAGVAHNLVPDGVDTGVLGLRDSGVPRPVLAEAVVHGAVLRAAGDDQILEPGVVGQSLTHRRRGRRDRIFRDRECASDKSDVVVIGGQALGRDGVCADRAARRVSTGKGQRAGKILRSIVAHEAGVCGGVDRRGVAVGDALVFRLDGEGCLADGELDRFLLLAVPIFGGGHGEGEIAGRTRIQGIGSIAPLGNAELVAPVIVGRLARKGELKRGVRMLNRDRKRLRIAVGQAARDSDAQFDYAVALDDKIVPAFLQSVIRQFKEALVVIIHTPNNDGVLGNIIVVAGEGDLVSRIGRAVRGGKDLVVISFCRAALGHADGTDIGGAAQIQLGPVLELHAIHRAAGDGGGAAGDAQGAAAAGTADRAAALAVADGQFAGDAEHLIATGPADGAAVEAEVDVRGDFNGSGGLRVLGQVVVARLS